MAVGAVVRRFLEQQERLRVVEVVEAVQGYRMFSMLPTFQLAGLQSQCQQRADRVALALLETEPDRLVRVAATRPLERLCLLVAVGVVQAVKPGLREWLEVVVVVVLLEAVDLVDLELGE